MGSPLILHCFFSLSLAGDRPPSPSFPSYFLAPSRFPINTAYVEGWGLYAESLGFELGLYDDPYDRWV